MLEYSIEILAGDVSRQQSLLMRQVLLVDQKAFFSGTRTDVSWGVRGSFSGRRGYRYVSVLTPCGYNMYEISFQLHSETDAQRGGRRG